MKIVIQKVPAGSQYKVGDLIEATGAQADVLTESGHEFITAAEHAALERITKAREASVDSAIAKAIERGAILPKEDTSAVKAKAIKMLLSAGTTLSSLACTRKQGGVSAVTNCSQE